MGASDEEELDQLVSSWLMELENVDGHLLEVISGDESGVFVYDDCCCCCCEGEDADEEEEGNGGSG